MSLEPSSKISLFPPSLGPIYYVNQTLQLEKMSSKILSLKLFI